MSAEQGISDRMIKALTTTAERAKSLLEDGYAVDPGTRTGVYIVTTPPKRAPKKYGGGEYRMCYEVDLANHTCDCDMFQHSEQALGVGFGTCKHLQRIETHVAEAARLAAPLFVGVEPDRSRVIPVQPAANNKPSVYSAYRREDGTEGLVDHVTGEVYEQPVARASVMNRKEDFD